MSAPETTVVITTRDRPGLLEAAVASALAQSVDSFEVVVVDDGSDPPVRLERRDRRLRLVRNDAPVGVCAARNIGLAQARGRFVSYLDDDDELLPHMLAVSLEAIRRSTLPPPVAALSGIEVVDVAGRVLEVRLPPASPRGGAFGLEPVPAELRITTKQTLVVPTETLRAIGGWDETFRSRSHTELFIRLNAVCSLDAVPIVTLRHLDHTGPRLSTDLDTRAASIARLLRRHDAPLRRHPQARARLLADLSRTELRRGRRAAAALAALRSLLADPARLGVRVLGRLRRLARRSSSA